MKKECPDCGRVLPPSGECRWTDCPSNMMVCPECGQTWNVDSPAPCDCPGFGVMISEVKKIRRRIEDRLRKADPEVVLRIAKELGVKIHA